MKKYKMALVSVIILILALTSVTPEKLNTTTKGPDYARTESEIAAKTKENAKPDAVGEIMNPIPFPDASPTFYRVEKVEVISPTSSKTETVDISPKLAISDDEEIFWEVTKVPEDRMTHDHSQKQDFIDGNHPDVHEITTHDHVDRTIGENPQKKRVKKILPPYHHPIESKRNTRNAQKTKITAIKTSDLKEMNHHANSSSNYDKGNNETYKSADESLVAKDGKNSKEISPGARDIIDKSLIKEEKLRNLKNINDQGELIIKTETNGEIIENGESINKKDKGTGIALEENSQQLTKKSINEGMSYRNEGVNNKLIKDKNREESLKFNADPVKDEVKSSGNDMSQSINLMTPHMATNPSFQQRDYENDMKYENNRGGKKNGGKTVVDNKYPGGGVENFFAGENTVVDINMQNASSTAAPNSKETPVLSRDPDSRTTTRQMKDVARELKTRDNIESKEYSTTPANVKRDGDLKIRNPEFLYPPVVESFAPTRSTLTESDYSELKKDGDEGDEIEGIRLVPNEFGMLIPSKIRAVTTERSIWELLKEREHRDPEDQQRDEPAPRALPYQYKKPTTKTLYEHFDTDSAEIEYETENFQHGQSNIEKHELPFSESLPWLQVKDTEFSPRIFESKKNEVKKQIVHTKINDFPNILPINKNHFEANEEMQIPRDLSRLLKLSELSQGESSINGVTVSIVDSGTNNDDYSRYGHRPSKWYLLLLTGNSTIVKLRRKDFTKYLKLNLAARLSVEYDDIKVNKVILAPPKVLVNISVYAPSDDIAEESQFDLKEKFEDKGEAPLYKLAETNATLLELSGEEYHVVRFLSHQSQKPEAEAQKDVIQNSMTLASRHEDIEFVIYTFLGSACACAVILTLFITLSKYFKKISEYEWPWNRPKVSSWKVSHRTRPDQDEFNGISPAVIYSGGFPQIRGSWMTGVGSRPSQSADPPNYAPSILQQYPGIELGVSSPHHKNSSLYPELQDRPTNSPRHNKLQIYNCGANNLVIPMPPQKEATKAIEKGRCLKNDVSDTHPLDVRIQAGEMGQDNPNFTN